MLASMKNMERFGNKPGVFAFSAVTGEEYSSNASDYFLVNDPDWVMKDCNGEPMELAIRQTYIIIIEEENFNTEES